MTDIAIRVQNLSKCYHIYDAPRDRLKQFVAPPLQRMAGQTPKQYFREFWALKDVSFEIEKGETIGIVGRNGSGKSTLLQLICGTLSPTGGNVETNGRIAALLELGAGFNPEFTGRENAYMNAAILGLNKDEVDARFDNIAAFADIGQFIEQPVKTYSSGMAVRLAFAVAINIDPEILVIDEALAVGDVGFQARCFAKINELKQQGVTLLFVSHSPGAVTQLCSRAILLDSGELLLNGTPYQTIRGYNYLANAGPRSFHDVRKEVVALSKVENSIMANSAYEPLLQNQHAGPVKDTISTIEAHFDQQLNDAIKSLTFDQRGGEISAISVTDFSGRVVNVLPVHQEFKLVFNVRFDIAFENVRFSWVIKTAAGLILGGGSTHPPGSGISVPGATSLLVTSHFVNIFSPGDYLIDIGVKGKIEKDNEFIHGISNAVGVRSVCYSLDNRNGIVDCLVDPFFTIEAVAGSTIPISIHDLQISNSKSS